MTRIIDKEAVRIIVIEEEKPQQCDFCGRIDELRPYGPKGEAICFDCGQKDPAATRRAYAARFFGAGS